MKLRECRLLTDENIDPLLVAYLRTEGFDVLDVCEQGLQGSTDVDLLRRSFQESRVIVSHDADFGTLALLQGEPVFGIVFLRPGHIDVNFTIQTVQTLLQVASELSPPFLLVAKRNQDEVVIRIRRLTN
jgi:predicted nuclease of predicted toxin-antitoxin system